VARIEGVSRKKAGWIVRLADRVARRRLGRSVEPIWLLGHRPALLFGVGVFEGVMQRGGCVEARLKELAQIRVATLVGCPF
jgi:hypothetical protein